MRYVALIAFLLTTAANAGDTAPTPSQLQFIGSPSWQLSNANKMVVTVRPDGTVKLGEGVTLDEASKAFWDQLQRMGMKMACPKSE